MIKVGDEVRFLNAVGGGNVIKIEGQIATVLEYDGFETPSLISELVVINSVNSLNFPTANKSDKEEFIIESLPPTTNYTFDEKDELPDKEQLSIYLAFVPHNIKELQSTAYECYLINDSNYYLNFSFFSGDNELVLHESGEIEPQTKLFLQDIEKDQLNEFQNIVFQAIALKKRKQFGIKSAIDIRKKLDLIKFYKLHLFVENIFFRKPAYLIALIEKDITK